MISKYKIFFLFVCAFFWNCTQTDFDLQIPPDEIIPENADHDLIVTKLLSDFRNSYSGYYGPLAPIVRYIEAGRSYERQIGSIDENEWIRTYDMGKNIQLIERFAENDESLVFHSGIARVMWAYHFANMVDLFGDIPYSEALQPIKFPHPKVDKGEDIYSDLYQVLDQAILDLKRALELEPDKLINPLSPHTDLMYKGNIEHWIRLANSLKLRLLVQTRLVNPEFSTDGINALIAEDMLISEISHDFEYKYGKVNSEKISHHPRFSGIYNDDNPGLLISNHFIYMLKNSKATEEEEEEEEEEDDDDDDDDDEVIEKFIDPRLRFYLYRQTNLTFFDEIDYCWNPLAENELLDGFVYCYLGDHYFGIEHGWDRSFSRASRELITIEGLYPIGGAFDNNAAIKAEKADTIDGEGIEPILLSSYVNFLLAEAALTLGTTGDAATYLQQAIEDSINKVTTFSDVSQSFRVRGGDIQNYVDIVMDMYHSAPTDEERLGIIIDEFYLAAWGTPLEIFNAYRRTGFPNFPPLIDKDVRNLDLADFPRSVSWPDFSVEQNESFNKENKLITDKVFWDTNPDGFID